MAEQVGAKPVGKTEAVYLRLKTEIENGDFEPGQALTEFMLVEHTGASRTPVREALRRLAAEGLVNIAPRVGATVARISLRTVRELFDYRRVLEPAAIRMVVQEAAQVPGITERFTRASPTSPVHHRRAVSLRTTGAWPRNSIAPSLTARPTRTSRGPSATCGRTRPGFGASPTQTVAALWMPSASTG
jgi:DNA-binding transcriptional MocR family regulator